MEQRSTLPVNEILAAERRERSWESAAAPGRWSHPSAADRGREVGDLDMAGLSIGAPARLQRGGRALPPTDASTPLGGDSGELPRTYSSSSARADYRRRLELNTQDSDEDVLFRREMNYPERGRSASTSWRQHTTRWELRGAAPHVLRLFSKDGLPTAARVERPGQRRGRSLPTRDELPREGSRWLLRSSTSRCRGEQRVSARASAGRIRVCDGV